MDDTLTPACQTCGGKCCAGWAIEVLPWLDEVPDRMVKQDRLLGPVMRERNGACIALRDGRCSIYEDRPKVCRDFEVGGAECQSRQMVPWANAGQPQRLTEAGRAYLLGRLEEQPSPSSVAPRRRSGA